MQHFTKLAVWARSHALTLEVYKVTKLFPREERYGITAQLQRAAASVPTNIAEGAKRKTRADFARFLNMAEGSLAEAEYLLYLSRDLGYFAPDLAGTLMREASEVSRMLNALRTKVEGR